MSKEFKTTVPDELAENIKTIAATEGVSVSSLISKALTEYLSKSKSPKGNEADDYEDDEYSSVRIELDGKDAHKLRIKARVLGLTPTAYVRNILYTKNFKVIEMPMTELREFSSTFSMYAKAVRNFINSIRASKSEISQYDIERLLDNEETIKELFNQQYKFLYTNRKKLYKDIEKKILIEIEKNEEEENE